MRRMVAIVSVLILTGIPLARPAVAKPTAGCARYGYTMPLAPHWQAAGTRLCAARVVLNFDAGAADTGYGPDALIEIGVSGRRDWTEAQSRALLLHDLDRYSQPNRPPMLDAEQIAGRRWVVAGVGGFLNGPRAGLGPNFYGSVEERALFVGGRLYTVFMLLGSDDDPPPATLRALGEAEAGARTMVDALHIAG